MPFCIADRQGHCTYAGRRGRQSANRRTRTLEDTHGIQRSYDDRDRSVQQSELPDTVCRARGCSRDTATCNRGHDALRSHCPDHVVVGVRNIERARGGRDGQPSGAAELRESRSPVLVPHSPPRECRHLKAREAHSANAIVPLIQHVEKRARSIHGQACEGRKRCGSPNTVCTA